MLRCSASVLPEYRTTPATYDILKEYLKDEEEDLYWSETTVELIEKLGEQHWLLTQL